MRYIVTLQSVSDVITNSSSEIYSIQTSVGETFLREWWDRKLLSLGYSQEEINTDDSIRGYIYEEDGCLILSYPVMCNIEEDIRSILQAEFGKHNVEAEY